MSSYCSLHGDNRADCGVYFAGMELLNTLWCESWENPIRMAKWINRNPGLWSNFLRFFVEEADLIRGREVQPLGNHSRD